jgi:hypothetical protein
MTTGVIPNSVHYRLLSEHFQACLDLSETEREDYLSGPNVGDLSLREELRSLLKFHDRPSDGRVLPSISRPEPTPTVRNERKNRFLGPFLIMGVSTLLLISLTRIWALGRLESALRADGTRRLEHLLEARRSSIRSWSDHQKQQARTLLEDPLVMPRVESLAELAQGPGVSGPLLRSSPAYAALSQRMSQAPPGLGDRGFCIFTPAGRVICSDPDVLVGQLLSLNSAASLRGLSRLGEWMVSRPYTDRRLGASPESKPPETVMCVGGPLVSSKGQLLAFGLFYFSPALEFYPLLSLSNRAECMLFDEKGLLLSDLKDPASVRRMGLLPADSDDHTALRVHLRDPGRELTEARRIATSPEQWPPTRMCLSAIQGLSGSDSSGYRNLLGRPVLGAWAWIPEFEMGIGAEEEVEGVLGGLEPLRSAFLVMLAVPAVLMGILFLGFYRRQPKCSTGPESRLGFYLVERAIGQGGMGDVFLATHTILNRPTALKILRESRPTTATVARFKREARMASRLGHPNSIQIFDYGETPDGRLFYAMEYVDGLNLAQLLTLEGPLSVGRSLYLLKQISGALEEAHGLGLLHRDLKPSNIMVGRKGGLGDVAKILDFGIASSVSEMSDDKTRSADLVGTPAYIAPERIRLPHQLDFRSDIYSFGGVAFHMLTGRSIFEGPGPAELIYQVLTSKRPSPSQLRGDTLPSSLEALILDCLAIEPELRPPSMKKISEDLRAVEWPEHWSQDEARAWWTSNRERVAKFRVASS